jgi:hypothetical protein
MDNPTDYWYVPREDRQITTRQQGKGPIYSNKEKTVFRNNEQKNTDGL